MDSKKLYSIIIILIIILSFLSYKYNDTNKQLEKYKGYYKDLSVMYLNEVIDAPELKKPSSREMKVTTIDFESNMLQFSDLKIIFSLFKILKEKIFLSIIGQRGVILV